MPKLKKKSNETFWVIFKQCVLTILLFYNYKRSSFHLLLCSEIDINQKVDKRSITSKAKCHPQSNTFLIKSKKVQVTVIAIALFAIWKFSISFLTASKLPFTKLLHIDGKCLLRSYYILEYKNT